MRAIQRDRASPQPYCAVRHRPIVNTVARTTPLGLGALTALIPAIKIAFISSTHTQPATPGWIHRPPWGGLRRLTLFRLCCTDANFRKRANPPRLSPAAPSWTTLGQALEKLVASRWSTDLTVSERWQRSKSVRSSSQATPTATAAASSELECWRCRSFLLVSRLLLWPAGVMADQAR